MVAGYVHIEVETVQSPVAEASQRPHGRAAAVTVVALVLLVLALVATLYPSWRAARVNPAEALRYE